MRIGLRTRWVLGAAAVIGIAGFLLWQQYWYYVPGLIQAIRDPVQANQPVVWAEGPAASETPAADRPPNIILIVADDLGYNDITLSGPGVANGAVPTPHIDSLAKEGVNFTRSYSGNATCAPSRAAIMTGRFATRFGYEFTPTFPLWAKVIANAESAGNLPAIYHGEHEKDYPSADTMQVPTGEIMIPQMLKARGYRTIGVGKWHLGDTATARPNARGFDEYLGFMAGAAMYLPPSDANVVNSRQDFYPPDKLAWASLPFAVRFNGGRRFTPSEYLTDYFAGEAARAIEANRNRPFFLYLAFNAPHTPLQALKSDYDALSGIADHRLRVYGAMIKALDRGVGTVLEAVRAQGLAHNTIVIFTSDNGGAAAAGLSEINRPFRGWKATFYEGGIRVPMFVRWPAKFQPGTVSSGAVAHVDIFATAAAVSGASMPGDRVMDGVNLVPLALGGEFPQRALFWRSGAYMAVLDGDWKLQSITRPARAMLFNLKDDPTELKDLAASQSARLAEMAALLKRINGEQAAPLWPSLVEAPIPIDHPFDTPTDADEAHIYWSN